MTRSQVIVRRYSEYPLYVKVEEEEVADGSPTSATGLNNGAEAYTK